MIASFLLKNKKKYIKIWNGKDENLIFTTDEQKARTFEIGWIRKNSNKIKELDLILIPVYKKIWLYGTEVKVDDLENNEPYKPNQCVCCGKEVQDSEIIRFTGRGYGSIFDSMNTKIPICNSCKPKNLDLWINEKCNMDDYSEVYQFENELEKWFEQLSVQGRELIYNTNNTDSMHHKNVDWILMDKGIARHDVYKNNHMWSPIEINAYNTKFPTCEEVIIKEYKSGSKVPECPYSSAHGILDKLTGQIKAGPNINESCLNCKIYEENKKYY